MPLRPDWCEPDFDYESAVREREANTDLHCDNCGKYTGGGLCTECRRDTAYCAMGCGRLVHLSGEGDAGICNACAQIAEHGA